MSERIVLFLPNWIGDVVMATPALRALRGYFADAEITAVMKPYVAEVLAGTDWIDEKLFFNPRGKSPEQRTFRVAAELRRRRPDRAIMFTNSFRSAAMARWSGARHRVGYSRYGRGFLLSQPLHAPRQGRIFTPVPAIDYFLGLAYAAGCPPESPRTELATLPKDEAIADGVWQALEIERCKDVVVFNTGGAYGSAKHWPTEYYVELARRIVEREDAAVLVICGPGERDNAAEIERSARHPRVKSMAEQDLSLGVAKACVRRSRLMVTTDSGPRQFAPAFGVPVVSLFGPIDPRWSETHFAGETTLIHPVPCGPCGKRICPLGHHRCMRDLSVERVYAAVVEKLSKERMAA